MFVKRAMSILLMAAVPFAASPATPGLLLNNSNIVRLSRYLEQQPLGKYATVIRGEAAKWEGQSKDVVDVVCPTLFMPPLSKTTKYVGILIPQFIIGSAAFQIANPSEKGKLLPQQVAGMRSMLAAYRSLLALDPTARIPRFDYLSAQEAKGDLAKVLKPLVAAACK